MFDWPQTIKRYWPAIFLSLALLLVLDGTISSLETCHPPPNGPGSSQNGEENCTVLQGPLASFIVGFANFFETHDKGIVAAFTVILAVSTILLWLATLNLYGVGKDQITTSRKVAALQARQTQRSIRESIRVARAAEKSAEAAVATERARFFVVIEHNFLECINTAAVWAGPVTQEEYPLPADIQPMAGIRFRNYGKTPGIVVDVSTGIEYSEAIPIPVFDEKVVMENIIAPGDLTQKFGTLINGQLTMAQAIKVRRGEGTLWVFGKITYDDVFGERQTHRYFQRLVRIGQIGMRYVLQSYDHEHYNRST
jgi:hypothetical protein